MHVQYNNVSDRHLFARPGRKQSKHYATYADMDKLTTREMPIYLSIYQFL